MVANIQLDRSYHDSYVYELLRDQIYHTVLAPGRRLRPGEIAERCQVSVKAVRNAILRLEQEGIIEATPYGFRAIRLTAKYITQIFMVRRALETTALRLSQGRLDHAELHALRNTWTTLQSSDEARPGYLEHYLLADDAFHQRLARFSSSTPMIESVGRVMWMSTLIHRWQFTRCPAFDTLRMAVDEHLRILDGLLAGDVEGAINALGEHLTREHELFLAGLSVDG